MIRAESDGKRKGGTTERGKREGEGGKGKGEGSKTMMNQIVRRIRTRYTEFIE